MTRAPMATQPAAPIKPKRARAKNAVAAEPVIHSIKGFASDLTCRDFQFVEGETYEHTGPIKACESGFHACTLSAHPFEVFGYYPPAGSRFHLVEQRGETNSDDSIKIASAKITIGYELSIGELTKRAIEWAFARSKPEGERATGEQGAASATGARGAASATGWQGAASATGARGAASATGEQGAASATGSQGAASATGWQGAASATGWQGAASATGTQGAASATGWQGAASATGWQGAASATGTQGAASATGTQGAASATGTRGAASATGWQGAASATGTQGAASATGAQGAASATGAQGAAMSSGYAGTVTGSAGNALFAVERGIGYNIISVAAGIVGKDGIEPGAIYRCVGGKLVSA
jgi:hypothetical protein